jgi:ABC-type nitrate/sulfonate/bicarbonate transport system substrate-binding protein
MLTEPAVSQAVASTKARLLGNILAAVAKRFLSALFAVVAPAADQHAAAMRAFAIAKHDSAAYTNTHLQATVELVATYSGIAPDVVAQSNRFIDADYAEPGLIQPVIDVMARHGFIKSGFPAEALIGPYALKRR